LDNTSGKNFEHARAEFALQMGNGFTR